MSETAAFRVLRTQLGRRAWLQAVVHGLSLGVLAAALAQRLSDASPVLLGALVAGVVMLWQRLLSPSFSLSVEDLAAHLNRCFPALEESAQLVLAQPSEQDVLASLQRTRVLAHWSDAVNDRQVWLPRLRWRGAAVFLLLGGVLLLMPVAKLDGTPQPETLANTTSSEPAPSRPQLDTVRVTPPSYTGLQPFETQSLDVELPEGSRVEWVYRYAGDAPLRVLINDMASPERQLYLQSQAGGLWSGSGIIKRTSLYRVEQQGGTGDASAAAVHTLTVKLDAAPTLRLLAPEETRIEIPRDGDPRIEYRVLVRDDYGVADVEILASVAKGSGEGVKFRDEVFEFDASEADGEATVYTRNWHLPSLGMEPGDEVYLFTRVSDNRPGGANEGRSETLVIRWLDEVEVLAAEEGLAISVMPEYFKSQRQIIIDTEQLIADRAALTQREFDQQSRDLGQAQSDLKERYGQYLGDEFDESEAPEGMVGPTDGGDDPAHEDDHEGHDHESDGHGDGGHEGHAHGAPAQMDTAGSAADLISRFGHNHGAAEVGPITRQSPVGLMRRSLANMWDAELRLRLSDPEGALPFEREALRYFDLARQADRIYTRRLGFEPPPVSEQRRLSGELEDIESRERQQRAKPDDSTVPLMQSLFLLLSTTAPGSVFDDAQLALLTQGARTLTSMAERRPALIRAAANVERLRILGVYRFADCADCQRELLAAIWTVLPAVEAPPGSATRRSAVPPETEALSP